jgi:hypothetical protein
MVAFFAPLKTSMMTPVASDSFKRVITESAFWAMMVPSKNWGGFLQTSQFQQFSDNNSPK